MISFVGMRSRTSGQIRCLQMSDQISGGEFIEYGDLRTPKNKIVILTRNYNKSIAQHYKNNGNIVGYDIADMPVGDAYFRGNKISSINEYCHNECDFFIVNNDLLLSEAKQYTNKKIFVIPHHNTNFNDKKNLFNEKIKKVGYIGLPEQLSKKNEIQSMLNSNGIEFISSHPNSREECDDIFTKLDIGIIFVDETVKIAQNNRNDLIDIAKKYKPNTKLTNFQCYGIPTICTEYESFKQFGENAYLQAESLNDVLNCLDTLINNPIIRYNLSNKSYEVGKKFNINNIKKLYEQIQNQI